MFPKQFLLFTVACANVDLCFAVNFAEIRFKRIRNKTIKVWSKISFLLNSIECYGKVLLFESKATFVLKRGRQFSTHYRHRTPFEGGLSKWSPLNRSFMRCQTKKANEMVVLL